MHGVRDVGDRDFGLGPARKQRREDPAAHAAVQLTDAVDARAAARREVRHVERLVPVVGVGAPETEQRIGLQAAEACVVEPVLLHQVRREGVERDRDRRVRREHVAGASRPQGGEEVAVAACGEAARPLDRGKRRMSFVQVAHLDVEFERFEGPPAADAEHDLLHQPCLAVARVELRRDAAVERRVERVVAVEEIELHAADGHAPDAHAQVASRQLDRDAQRRALGVVHELDGE